MGGHLRMGLAGVLLLAYLPVMDSFRCIGDCGGQREHATWLKGTEAVDADAVQSLGTAQGVPHSGLPSIRATRLIGREPVITNPAVAGPTAVKKIAFLFLVRAQLTLPKVWEAFFDGADPAKYDIFVHASDTGEGVPGLTKAKLVPRVPTTWCALFGAETALLKAALDDTEAEHFIFVGNDAIPLMSFGRIYKQVMKDPQSSTFCMDHQGRADHGARCTYFSWLGDVPKHEQWITLSRSHAQLVVQRALSAVLTFNELEVKNSMKGHNACSDELAPLVALLMGQAGKAKTSYSALGILHECRTFAHWKNCVPDEVEVYHGGHDMDVVLTDDKHPTTFRSLPVSYLRRLQHAGYLFARKFAAGAVPIIDVKVSSTLRNKTVLLQEGSGMAAVMKQLWLALDT